jgi:hypothetical protein
MPGGECIECNRVIVGVASGGHATNFAVEDFIVVEKFVSGGVQISTLGIAIIKVDHIGSFTISLISW